MTTHLPMEDLQAWPSPSPLVPLSQAEHYDWAVALIKDGECVGIYVHKNESVRDMEIKAGRRPDISYVLVSDLQGADRRWKIAHHNVQSTKQSAKRKGT